MPFHRAAGVEPGPEPTEQFLRGQALWGRLWISFVPPSPQPAPAAICMKIMNTLAIAESLQRGGLWTAEMIAGDIAHLLPF